MLKYLEGSDFRCCSFRRESNKDAKEILKGEKEKPFNFGNGQESGNRFYEAYCLAVEIYMLRMQYGEKMLEYVDEIADEIAEISDLYTKQCVNSILLEVEEAVNNQTLTSSSGECGLNYRRKT